MAEKITTMSQLKKLAFRSKVEFAARISELAALIAAGLEDAQHGITLTLPAANWSDNVQTVEHQFLLADNNYWYLVSCDADVEADDITVNGQIAFRCKTTPNADLTVNILRLEV